MKVLNEIRFNDTNNQRSMKTIFPYRSDPKVQGTGGNQKLKEKVISRPLLDRTSRNHILSSEMGSPNTTLNMTHKIHSSRKHTGLKV